MSSNEKYNPDNEHSQEKLRIYSEYLAVYLNVLLNMFDSVNIYDMMAGKTFFPKGESEVKGSAILALEAIKKCKEIDRKSPKKVRLYLNDIESENYLSLRDYTKNENWVHCQNEDVNKAISDNLGTTKADKNLFYLDPYGYTQIKKESVDAIVSKTENECLLFVPVTRIVQFIKKKEPIEGQEKCIADFLTEYSINIAEHKNMQWDEWGKIIKDGLSKSYCKSYVGMAKLQTRNANYYAIYFIGNHLYGLDRFTDTVERMKRQKGFFPLDSPEIMSYLSQPRTNCDLYKHMLREGWSCSSAKVLLRSLEEQNKISVKVLSAAKKKRRMGSFYLSHKAEPIICVQAIEISTKGENSHDIWN